MTDSIDKDGAALRERAKGCSRRYGLRLRPGASPTFVAMILAQLPPGAEDLIAYAQACQTFHQKSRAWLRAKASPDRG